MKYETKNSILYQGDCLNVLRTLPDGIVDVCVTSPPYWNLRSYLPNDHPDKPKEIGLEKSLDDYVNGLVNVFREVRRVMKDHATLFLNLGDSFLSADAPGPRPVVDGMASGQLLGVPWRVAFALQADGWLLRSDIILTKLSAMPESVAGWRWTKCRVNVKAGMKQDSQFVTGRLKSHSGEIRNTVENAVWSDCPGCPKCEKNGGLVLRRGKWRPTRAHEHLFLLAKSDRYFCDGEAVKTTPKQATVMRDRYSRVLDDKDEQYAVKHDHETICAGANLRDWLFWKNEPSKLAHYAAFPTFIPRLAIDAGTSAKGNCAECGMPIVRVIDDSGPIQPSAVSAEDKNKSINAGKTGCATRLAFRDRTKAMERIAMRKTLSWRPCCDCDAGTEVAVVLDPFAGTSTTGVVAIKKGRKFVGIELSEEYCKLSLERLRKAEMKRGMF